MDCPFDCGARVSPRELVSHLSSNCSNRMASCNICHKELAHKHLDKHMEECPLKPIICQFCKEQFPQNDSHSDFCHLKPWPCSYKDFGCEFLGPTSVLEDHEKNISEHLLLFSSTMAQVSNSIRHLQEDTEKEEFKIKLNKIADSISSLNDIKETMQQQLKNIEFSLTTEREDFNKQYQEARKMQISNSKAISKIADSIKEIRITLDKDKKLDEKAKIAILLPPTEDIITLTPGEEVWSPGLTFTQFHQVVLKLLHGQQHADGSQSVVISLNKNIKADPIYNFYYVGEYNFNRITHQVKITLCLDEIENTNISLSFLSEDKVLDDLKAWKVMLVAVDSSNSQVLYYKVKNISTDASQIVAFNHSALCCRILNKFSTTHSIQFKFLFFRMPDFC